METANKNNAKVYWHNGLIPIYASNVLVSYTYITRKTS